MALGDCSEISSEEFVGIVNDSSIVVVSFFAEWCMNCLMMEPIIEDLAEQMKEIKFVRINIEDNNTLANKLNVSKLPCLVIFKEGVEINRLKGNQNVGIIEQAIKSSLN